ncbi:MAG: hypothetical protein PHH37_14630 [Paludibacter sp.]|nr:hypothetical protein [Paludibacter sp.]
MNRFTTEAAKRGQKYNFEQDGLIIEFTDLSDNRAGLCHYEKPIRIEIDSIYWREISNTKGADEMKEDLIFHEMGHGILGRDHINTLLENGDWKSIMCGGDKVGDRPWNINYRGERRDYYIDELFDESTSQPSFASMIFDGDSTGFSDKVYLSFDTSDKSDFGWEETDNNSYKITNDNKRLKFESKLDVAFLILAETKVNVLSDFIFSFSIECQSNTNTDQYGLIFGSQNNENDAVEYSLINNNQKMYMGNRLWYSYYTELTRTTINKSGINYIKVFKSGNMLYYFINGIYSYCTECELDTAGSQFGFFVPPLGTAWLNDFRIMTKQTAQIKSTGNTKSDVSFNVYKVETNNNLILSK